VTARLQLKATYLPFNDPTQAGAPGPAAARGALFVDVVRASRLTASGAAGARCNAYVVVRVGGQKNSTAVVPGTSNPVFNAHLEYFDVQVTGCWVGAGGGAFWSRRSLAAVICFWGQRGGFGMRQGGGRQSRVRSVG
jgi:hypothetical protein